MTIDLAESGLVTGAGMLIRAAGVIEAQLAAPAHLKLDSFTFKVDGIGNLSREVRDGMEKALNDKFNHTDVYIIRISDGIHRSGVPYSVFSVDMKSSLLH